MSDVDFRKYTYATIYVENIDDTNDDEYDFEVYQDGILVTNVTSLGKGQFLLELNPTLKENDRTNLTIKYHSLKIQKMKQFLQLFWTLCLLQLNFIQKAILKL